MQSKKAIKPIQKEPAESKRRLKAIVFSAVIIVSVVYIVWRMFFTLPWQYGLLSMIVGTILVISEGITIIEAFVHFRNASRVKIPEMPVIPDEMYPDVDILITTHNETEELLYKTINGCKFMHYPDKDKVHIYICDDKDRPEIRQLAEDMDVSYIGFSGNQHAKAGNVNYSVARTSSPLIATLDADMIPTSKFLMEIVPYFFLPVMVKENGKWRERTAEERKGQKEIGYVQTMQSFYNPDMVQRNLYLEDIVPNEQDYFFRSVNVARMHSNSAAYAGSNAIFLRKALEEIGCMPTYSITEDFATSTLILGRGYRTLALDKELAHGLSPDTAQSLIKQRQRWSRGAAQAIWVSSFWSSGMSWKAKSGFLIAYMYWWTYVRRFIFILCPILFGLFNVMIADTSFFLLLAIWIPYFAVYAVGLKFLSGKTTNSLWSSFFDTILFPYMLWPIIAGTLKIPLNKFFVTPKHKETGRNSTLTLAIPHIILSIASIVSIVFCVQKIVLTGNYGISIILFWLLYNLYIMINAIIYYWGRKDESMYERIKVALPVALHFADKTFTGTTVFISEDSMEVLLDSSENIPDATFTVEMSYGEYKTTMEVCVDHIMKPISEDGSTYIFRVAEITEANRQQYLQILYDRDHQFQRVINFGIFTSIKILYRSLMANRLRKKTKAVAKPIEPYLVGQSQTAKLFR